MTSIFHPDVPRKENSDVMVGMEWIIMYLDRSWTPHRRKARNTKLHCGSLGLNRWNVCDEEAVTERSERGKFTQPFISSTSSWILAVLIFPRHFIQPETASMEIRWKCRGWHNGLDLKGRADLYRSGFYNSERELIAFTFGSLWVLRGEGKRMQLSRRDGENKLSFARFRCKRKDNNRLGNWT